MRPLEGVRVLDLSRLLPGPYASMVLADLGATVDRIEEAPGGDYLRHMPPQVAGDAEAGGDQSALFLAINRNKRSACLDLKKEGGRRALLALASKADVLLEQFRPGVLDRLGVGHGVLRAQNPRLVVCALTGYGQDGPLAKRAGHDIDYLARAGILGLTGPADAPPQPPGFQLADIGGALWTVIAILAALAERARTGEGRVLDVSMVESSMGFAAASFGLLAGGVVPKRGAEALTGGIAPYRTYATQDGRHVALGALEPKFWMAFCAGVGLEPELSALMPGPHQEALIARVAAIFASRTLDAWRAFARDVDCCLEPVLLPGELRGDEQLAARRVFFDLPSPWGALLQVRTPVTAPDATHAPPPRAGEHTDVILREAGLDEAAIATLRAERAVA